MRVGIFTECYHPVLNGVVVSIDTFREELEKRGHEFYIFTTRYPGHHETDPHIIRFPYWWPTQAKGGSYPIARPHWFVSKTAKRVQSFELDLIHSQHLLNLGSLGLKVAQRLGLPAILTYHTLLTEYVHYAVPLIRHSRVLRRIAQRWVITKSRHHGNQYDTIVTPSPSMKKLLRSYGVTVPIEPIPTGIKPEDFEDQYSPQELRIKWDIPEDAFILLYVSRIGKEKNVQFLLEAMRNLVQKRGRHNCHLLMVGGGPELRKYRRLVASWQMTGFITFTDALPKDETNRTYGGADIFVFPSVTETQGIIVFEALISGLPVVAINQMGPSDYIIDGVDGFLTPLKIEQFNDRIESLLDDENRRRRMGEKARENALKYTSQKCAGRMEKLYEQTINHHRSQSNP